MMFVFTIVILVLNISVILHPFPHLCHEERMVNLNNINDPKYHAAIPNGSHGWRRGCCLKARPPPK